MIQKSKIGVGAPSKNANFGPVEYVGIRLHVGPVELFGASQGAIIAYPIGKFPARIGFFFSIIYILFYIYISRAPASIIRFITSLYQNCALSPYFTIIADTIRK